MKIFGLLSLSLLFSLVMPASDTRVSPRFRTVYILQMSNELDQHLASRLTNGRVLSVVLDPAQADAVLTDSIDAAFWKWMQRTYPAETSTSAAEHASTTVPDVPPPAGHRGTVFLVDPRKRVVLWSTYELAKDMSPAELDRIASRVANQLKSALNRK